MADIVALKAELLAGHPNTGDYDADDAVAADQLNVVNRTVNKISMTASEVLNAIDQTEFEALSDANEEKIWNVLSMGVLDPFGLESAIFTSVFGAGSATITKLKDDRVTAVSRGDEIGLGVVFEGNVSQARAS